MTFSCLLDKLVQHMQVVFTFECLRLLSPETICTFSRVQVCGFLTQMLFGFQPNSFRTTVLERNIYCYNSLMGRLDFL